MPSEERVMRAREAVKRALDSVEHQMDNYLPAKGESGRDCERRRLIETMADYMLAFADEGSGIGELLKRARWYVADSLEAHEHADGRELLNEIDRALAASISSKEAE